MKARTTLARAETGVSPVIATVLLLAIMLTIVSSMLAWGIPQLQRSEANAHYRTTYHNLLNVEADLKQVALQGNGASRATTFSFSAGTMVVRQDIESWVITYTAVPWADLAVRSLKLGGTDFRVHELTDTAAGLVVNLSYPNGSYYQRAVIDDRVAGVPPLVSGVRGTVTTLGNATLLGGFHVAGIDAFSYQYASMAGVFALRLLNGGVLAKEPGGSYYLASTPLVRGTGDLAALHIYLLALNTSGSTFTSLGAGNYLIGLQHQAGADRGPYPATGVRLAVEGRSQAATYTYFVTSWGFTRDNQADEVFLHQETPLDLRIMERTVHVSLDLR